MRGKIEEKTYDSKSSFSENTDKVDEIYYNSDAGKGRKSKSKCSKE